MEHEDLLPQSQVPGNFSYPEPSRSSPRPKFPLPEDPSEYYLPIYAWVSQVVLCATILLPICPLRIYVQLFCRFRNLQSVHNEGNVIVKIYNESDRAA